MFCKNGFAKGKNKRAATVVQEHFLFTWLYYSTKFYFVNRFLKKILGFCRTSLERTKKIAYQSGKYAARCAAGYNPTEEPSEITAVPRTPAAGGRPSSVTVRAAPHRATFPKGKAMCSAQSTEFTIVRTAVTPAAGGASRRGSLSFAAGRHYTGKPSS